MKKFVEMVEEYLPYKIGETVYLKTDPEQLTRIVYSYTIYRGEIVYNLTQNNATSGHYDFEISTEKTVF